MEPHNALVPVNTEYAHVPSVTADSGFTFKPVGEAISISTSEKVFVSVSPFSSVKKNEPSVNSKPAPPPISTPRPTATVSISSTNFPDCVERHSNSNKVTGSWWLWFGLVMFVLGMWVHHKLRRGSAVNIHVDRRH